MKKLVSSSLKKAQSKKGFTLIELIVVIAILAILAVVLIPAINGWVQKSHQSAALNNAASVKSAASIVYTEIQSGEITKTLPATVTQTDTDMQAQLPNMPAGDAFSVTIAADGTITGTYTSSANITVNIATMAVS